MPGVCKICNKKVEGSVLVHYNQEHPQERVNRIKAALAKKKVSSTEQSKEKADSTKTPLRASSTTKLAPGEIVHIVPKAFTTTSTLFWNAWELATNEWGWPKDMSPQNFLDNVLFYYCIRRGHDIRRGYSKVETDGHKGLGKEELTKIISDGVAAGVEAALSKLRGG